MRQENPLTTVRTEVTTFIFVMFIVELLDFLKDLYKNWSRAAAVMFLELIS